MVIWLSGPTGAGKTSLARLLRRSGYFIVEENIPRALFQAFVSQPAANCEALQHHLMQARFDGWLKVSGASRIAFDRSISEDIEVFCRMHMRAGLLTQGQFEVLAQVGRELQNKIPAPSLIVFVTSDTEVLMRRMHNSAAPSPIIENLRDQILLYSEWLENRNEEILKLDTTRLSESTLARIISEIQTC
jgi:deoxyadenosine/deoxycytidine kinase